MSSSTSYSMRLIVKSKGEIDPGVWILRVEASGSGLTSSIILYWREYIIYVYNDHIIVITIIINIIIIIYIYVYTSF
jgi:hypothetical protein